MAAPAGDSGGSSPLSNMDSDVDYDEYYQQEQEHEQEQEQEAQAPPAKRPRLSMNPNSRRGTPVSHRSEPDNGSISSDTEGDVPNSPGMSRFDDEEGHHEQVTVCSWDGCDRGDCGDMDQLVQHIHADHIEGRGKKYTCEWSDCSRKSYPHASAYALKAHMRSHTREKPFFCTLPGEISRMGWLWVKILTASRMRPLLYKIRCTCKAHAHCPRNRSITAI